jgi:hypothetical protein
MLPAITQTPANCSTYTHGRHMEHILGKTIMGHNRSRASAHTGYNGSVTYPNAG